MGKKIIYPLIAQGEYAAIPGYEKMMKEFPEVESVKDDRKMTKAIFMDYTGTMVKEDEPYTREHLEESMKLKDLHPAGIISAESAGACKPHKKIFEKALEIAGVAPSETVHIGDSVISDIEPALAIGITPVYLARKEHPPIDGIRVIRSLSEYER